MGFLPDPFSNVGSVATALIAAERTKRGERPPKEDESSLGKDESALEKDECSLEKDEYSLEKDEGSLIGHENRYGGYGEGDAYGGDRYGGDRDGGDDDYGRGHGDYGYGHGDYGYGHGHDDYDPYSRGGRRDDYDDRDRDGGRDDRGRDDDDRGGDDGDRGRDDVIVPHNSYATRSRLNILKDESPLEKDKNVLDVLCSTCARLNISAKKFIVHGNHIVPAASYVFDPTGLKSVVLGYLDDIYSRRSKCSFCMLVYKATHQRNSQGIGHDGLDKGGGRVLCNLNWQLDGRNGNPTRFPNQGHGGQRRTEALTRRARLYSKTDAFPDAFIVLLPDPAWGLPSPTFLGRIVDQQQINPDQLRHWISTCHKHHGRACRTLPNAEPAAKRLYMDMIRFIDVDQLCLVEAPFESTEYIALSYVWGRAKQPLLLSSNFQLLHSMGGFRDMLDTLPRTIQDSIRLVKLLGLHYLWVDCLCIRQDDEWDKRVLIGMMDRIYGSSVLTICAASGGDSETGLPGIHQPRELSQDRERCAGVDLLVVRPVEDRIKDTIWNSRAWTFQERLLSNRCLVFVDDRVFFQCRQATWSEELDCEAKMPTWNLDIIRSPLAVFKENPLRRYATCVQLYSGRMLTTQSDKLNAFEGIGNVLRKPLKANFHYGLPNSHFDWAL